MPKIPGIPHLQAVRALEKAGFRIVREGKHVVMSDGRRILTIPRHNPVNAYTGRSGDDDPRGNAVWKGSMSWACPRCHRAFRQVNQRHACGVGSTGTLLKGRPAALAELYRTLEAAVGRFGEVEVVTRDRYALFRTTRIFADLTVTRDALRVVVHLGRKVRAPFIVKAGPSGKRVSHVVLVRTAEDLRTIMPFLREAFDLADAGLAELDEGKRIPHDEVKRRLGL